MAFLLWRYCLIASDGGRLSLITKYMQTDNDDGCSGLLALDDESWHNLVNFFDLLLQVDRRVNPHLYQAK